MPPIDDSSTNAEDVDIGEHIVAESILTDITAGGCNLAGLANIFAVVGALWVTTEITTLIIRTLLLIRVLCASTASHLVIRIRFGGGGIWNRLFSRRAGGCLCAIPSWAICPSIAVQFRFLCYSKNRLILVPSRRISNENTLISARSGCGTAHEEFPAFGVQIARCQGCCHPVINARMNYLF